MDTKKLRQKILDLAIRGKLVPQDPNDEPASVLLERIRAEKQQLIKEGKIKASKGSKACDTSHYEKIDGPFEIPESWEWCKIDDIGEVITGNTPPKSQKNYFGGPIPFFKPTDLEQGFKTTKSSDSLTIDGYKVSRQLPKNSILVTCIGATIGKTGIIRNEGSCNQQINAIVPATIINPEYIYFLCISNYFQKAVKTSASATTLPILNKNSFAKLLLPLPPEKEQNEIVQTIQKWLSYVENIENSIIGVKKDAEVTKSKILSLAISGKLIPQDPSDEPAIELLRRINPDFKPCDNSHYGDLPIGWSICTLYDICDTINGLWKGKNPPFVNVGVIRNANFTKDFNLDYSKIEYIDVEQRAYEKRNLEDGDLIVEKSGGSDNFPVGRSILYQGESGKYSFSNFTMALRIKDKSLIHSKYLYFVILHKYLSGEMTQMQTQTTGLHNLLSDKYMSMPIPIPPTNEQNRIIGCIEKLLNQLNNIKTVL